MSGSKSSGPRGKKPRPKALPAIFLGDPLPEREESMWATLNQTQRAKAMQRMFALTKWLESDGGIDVKVAAGEAGVSVTRMYEMGKAWREHRSLAALGTFAGAPKTRVPGYDDLLRHLVGPIVAADSDGSVRKLALALESASGLPSDEMPSHNTMRHYVENELRRRGQQGKAGDDLMLDCSACTLTPSETSLVTVFAILDRWTQLILGAALGSIDDSRAGYAVAARDAVRRLQAGQFRGAPWVVRMSRMEAVIGLDQDRWSNIRREFANGGILAPIELSTKKDRFGRYLRPLTGLRIGTVVILPTHTVEDKSAKRLVRVNSPTPDQINRLAVEVDDHNAEIVSRIDSAESTLPDDLQRALVLLSSS